VICATHRRIRDSVTSGQFREDLYFRLNGLTVMLPPLRSRTDIDALVGSLLRELGGTNPPSLDPDVLELFRRHPWPGNVRQLSNLLRTAVIMAEGEPTIRREHLPDDFIEDVGPTLVAMAQHPGPQPIAAAVAPAPTSLPSREPAEASAGRLQDVALQAIRDALTRNGGNISCAARELGVSRSTLYRKLQS
jgi:transcriptional regulator of acetoin/glycerol metabolism